MASIEILVLNEVEFLFRSIFTQFISVTGNVTVEYEENSMNEWIVCE